MSITKVAFRYVHGYRVIKDPPPVQFLFGDMEYYSTNTPPNLAIYPLILAPRSISAFRISVAIVTMCDLGLRFRDLHAHYTNSGVLPVDLLTPVQRYISLFALSDSIYWVYWIFILGFVSAMLLLYGRFPRLSSLLCLVVIISLQRRNPVVTNAGDSLLRLLLMWLCFFPQFYRWPFCQQSSHKDHETRRLNERLYSAASWGLTVQVCIVYIFSALAKGDPMWRIDSTAIEHALRLESFRTQFSSIMSPYLLEHHVFLKLATKVVLWLEQLGPILLLLSTNRPCLRGLVIIGFVFFHLICIAPFLNIGMFPFVCASAWVAFVPDAFWQYLDKVRGVVPVLPAGSLKTLTYKIPSAHRSYNLFQTSICQIITCFVVIYNVVSILPVSFKAKYHLDLRPVATLIGVDQSWNLFAPYVNTRDGWFVSKAKLTDGRMVDVIRSRPNVSWEKPCRIASEFPTKRWRRFLLNLYHNRDPQLIQSYVSYLTRKWNSENPAAKISTLSIFFMLQDSRYPEDGVTAVQVFPIHERDRMGLAIFLGDSRRNGRLR